ncbi:hypothetical protein BCR39DRAFT_59383 [Naematelia encephala]|uniref:Glycosyltransferase family 32 protein n=1 Tax=Naematelia encephala TaxID=71784 RepID=A0A1Y2BBM9_9TREE|nr:hypothetical protein BCR39DRAFT_59383 [Naematelia encephala]
MGQTTSVIHLTRRGPILIALLVLTFLFASVHILRSGTEPLRSLSSRLRTSSNTFLTANDDKGYDYDGLVPSGMADTLAEVYEDERLSLLSNIGFNQDSEEAAVRTRPGGLDPDFNAYITRLETFVDEWFGGSKHYSYLNKMLDRLVHAQPPPMREQEFQKNIISFDKDGRAGVPDEFAYWDKRMAGQGWNVEVGDDESMEQWFNSATQEQAGREGIDGEVEPEFGFGDGVGAAKWRTLWDSLQRPVLKADLLRYLLMLVEGGLYTDSDTAPLSDINLWGTNAHHLTPPTLRVLQRAMRHLSKMPIPGSELESETDFDEDSATNPVDEVSLGIKNPRVALVVSVEYDVGHERQDPRFGYTRDLQIVQWTFLAKPFHPVFLDVLETATHDITQRHQSGKGEDSWQAILDGTGPGPFTDAVLRYLLIQYGVAPSQLRGMEDGALIGDVLLLPLHAFGSYLGGEEDWNAHDPSTRCVAHGFRGRWKGDINFEERKRKRSGNITFKERRTVEKKPFSFFENKQTNKQTNVVTTLQ